MVTVGMAGVAGGITGIAQGITAMVSTAVALLWYFDQTSIK